MENKFKITEGDLVSIKVQMSDGNIWPWFKVLFVDLDGTFIARLEKYHKWVLNQKNHPEIFKDHKFLPSQISGVIKEQDISKTQFCYSDDITVCDCPGTCRNK